MLSRIKETELGKNVALLDGVVKEGLRAEVMLEERSSWEKKSWSVPSPSVLSIFYFLCLLVNQSAHQFPRKPTFEPRNKPWDTGGMALPDEQEPRV